MCSMGGGMPYYYSGDISSALAGVFYGLLEGLFWMSFLLIRCGCCVFWGIHQALYWLLLVLTGHYWQPCWDVL